MQQAEPRRSTCTENSENSKVSAQNLENKRRWRKTAKKKVEEKIEENVEAKQTLTLDEVRVILKEKIKMKAEAYVKRKNLLYKKGEYWNEGVKLEEWINRKAAEWSVEISHKTRAAGVAKIVTFERKATTDEFWFRREEIKKEAKCDMDEDLSFEERAQRHKLVELGKEQRSEGKFCRIENRYLVLIEGEERVYKKWNQSIGLYEVCEPTEEKKMKEREQKLRRAREKEEWIKRQDW